jgi:hypothetical protein
VKHKQLFRGEIVPFHTFQKPKLESSFLQNFDAHPRKVLHLGKSFSASEIEKQFPYPSSKEMKRTGLTSPLLTYLWFEEDFEY